MKAYVEEMGESLSPHHRALTSIDDAGDGWMATTIIFVHNQNSHDVFIGRWEMGNAIPFSHA